MENGKKLRVLELYSGIGGMRYALEFADIPYEIVAAVDINPVVNCIYIYNFGNSNHLQRNINSFTAEELDNMELNIITMSPPCQPFTRVGLKKDIEDARSCSFLHIVNIISQLQHKPTFILLENVKGFEESAAHDILIESLNNNCYNFQEYLLSPADFGIPNSRLRYYIIATHESSKSSFPFKNEVLTQVPSKVTHWMSVCSRCAENKLEKCIIQHFLEDKPEDYFNDFLIPNHVLLKYAKVLDIVYEISCHSCCFTKAYGRYALGTGSVFTHLNDSEVFTVFKSLPEINDEEEKIASLKSLRLRYFTPKEIANLMCFPNSFSVPPTVNNKQMYKALGNSINVFVVSNLLQLLILNKVC